MLLRAAEWVYVGLSNVFDCGVVLMERVIVDEQAEAVQEATERAERAEAELAELKNTARPKPHAEAVQRETAKTPPSPSSSARPC